MPTRFYLGLTVGSPPITPTPDSSWSGTTGFDRYVTDITADGTTLANMAFGPDATVANRSLCCVQYLYPLPAGIAFTTAQTFKGQMAVKESLVSNGARSQYVVRILASNGTTVRATLIGPDTDATGGANPANEWSATSQQNRNMLRGQPLACAANYTTVSGDCLVIEFGFWHNGSSSATGTLRLGGNGASDLPEDETTTTASRNPWFEWSGNFPAPLNRTAGQSARLSNPNLTRTAPQSTVIQQTFGRTAAQTAAIVLTFTRTATSTGRISVPGLTRSGAQTGRISAPGLTRLANQTGCISTPGLPRTGPSTAAIWVTFTRTAPNSAAIRITLARTIAQTAVISTAVTYTRTIAQTAAIKTTNVAGTWQPGLLSGSVLKRWLAADRHAVQTNGTILSAWTDSSPNRLDFAAAPTPGVTAPTIRTNIVNGLPTMRFADGSGTAVWFTSGSSIGLDTQPFTIVFIANPLAGAVEDLFTAIIGNDAWVSSFPSGYQFYAGFTQQQFSSVSDGQWHISALIFDDPSPTAVFDGALVSPLGPIGTGTLVSGVTIGIDLGSMGNYLDGDIAEVAFIAGALTTAERERWDGYLAWKYGIVANLPTAHPYKTWDVYTGRINQTGIIVFLDQKRQITQRAVISTAGLLRTVNQTSAISTVTIRTITQTVAISTVVTLTRTANQTACLSVTGLTRTASQSVSLSVPGLIRTAPQSALILTTLTRIAPQTATIQQTLLRTSAQSAVIADTFTRTVSQTGTILVLQTRTASQFAVIAFALTRTAPQTATILVGFSRLAASSAVLAQPGIAHSIPQTAAIQAGDMTRLAPQTVSLATAAVTRFAPESVSILTLLTRQGSQSVTITLLGLSRQAAQSAVLSITLTRTINQAAVISTAGLTRTAAQTASLLIVGISQRIVPQSAVISTAAQLRTINQTAALLFTVTRVTGQTGAILVPATRQISETAAIRTADLVHSITQTGTISLTFTRIAAQTATISTGTQRIAAESAVLKTTELRTAAQASAISTAALTRTNPQTAALRTTGTRSSPQTAVLSTGAQIRTVPQSGVVQITLSRLALQTAVLATPTLTRTIPQTAIIALVGTRTASQGAAIRDVQARTGSQSVIISVTSTRQVTQGALISTPDLTRQVSQTATIVLPGIKTIRVSQTVIIRATSTCTAAQSATISLFSVPSFIAIAPVLPTTLVSPGPIELSVPLLPIIMTVSILTAQAEAPLLPDVFRAPEE